MATPYTLFEVSWEVCNKVSGIHTVISAKARTLVERFGDDYLTVGPWLLSEKDRTVPFEDDPSQRDFAESCRLMGVPVRVGRWLIPGAPRAILVEFSELYDERDAILSALWDDFGVDSISGGWDYAEPVLFGHAAGRVIEKWWEEHLAPHHRRAVVQVHEWTTVAALLYASRHVPSVGTVFTTHATVLGRTLASAGRSTEDGLGGASPEDLADAHGVLAKHSIEHAGARHADVFTTVSEITAQEAELLHGRAPDPLTYNGIDLEVIDRLVGDVQRASVRERLQRLAERFLGERIGPCVHACITGRYEFHNKGIDVTLEAMALLAAAEGRRAVLWILVPAGHSGLLPELAARSSSDAPPFEGPLGVSTHALFDAEADPIQKACARLGLTNERGSRVRVIHVPLYLEPGDGLLDLSYEAVLSAMDVSCFPSFYEPWGYAPQESLAVGVPTITTDRAGFGRWALRGSLSAEDGITVLSRLHVPPETTARDLAHVLERFLAEAPPAGELAAACRRTAALTTWTDFAGHYEEAYARALASVERRLERTLPPSRRPKLPVSVQPAPAGSVPRLIPFDVSATLPESLRGLERLSRNLWWCWDPEASQLFEELSPRAWEDCEHKPVAFLRRVYPEDLRAKARDAEYVARIERVLQRFRTYVAEQPAPIRLEEPGGALLTLRNPIAYFCAEYGMHESLPIYSGGLGVLAGDHLKSASDLCLPFVAVGLFYSRGYLTQRVTPAGEQIAIETENDPRELPLELVRAEGGEPLDVPLQLPGRELHLRAWRVWVGRVPLYLLDADVDANRPEDRAITSRLYAGDHETRIQQEIVLGRGGFRLLARLGIEPAAYHVNEGHAAFLLVERLAHLVRNAGHTFDEAREVVRATTLFTTHTPVPAGHDRFGEDLMRRYFSDLPDRIGLSWEAFYALGHSQTQRDAFNMTYLALRFSSICNGVSKLHGIASRRLLRSLWPGLLVSEVPVRSITNGVHLGTWTLPEISRLLGAPERAVRGADFAERAASVDPALLWEVKRQAKARLLRKVRASLSGSFLAQHDSPLLLTRILDGLDEEALYVGFARRFAPYKRADLIFSDPARLHRLLDDSERPVRLLVAGKAHPADQHGRDILRLIHETARRDEFAGRVVFIENYEIDLARAMVQGVDVWLNNPVRMLEASGTSGMKAAANGALNLSVGDGWWPEAYDGTNGWTIAEGHVYEDQALQSLLDSAVLYRLFEEEILPLYFTRDEGGVPRAWMQRVLRSLATIPPAFDSERMVREYLEQGYLPLARRFFALSPENRATIRDLAQTRHRIRRDFPGVSIATARIADLSGLEVGDAIDVHVEVDLGALRPEDVAVELVFGPSTGDGDLHHLTTLELECASTSDGHLQSYQGTHRMERPGAFAYGIRVRPKSASDPGDSLRDLVLWA